jgi:acid phosphatase class B
MAKMHVADGDIVMFVSARNNSERDITTQQIQEWIGIENPVLFMRPDGDYRADDVFKKDVLDILREHIGGDPDVVYDDRNRVVDMWKANGINVVQVVPRDQGDF